MLAWALFGAERFEEAQAAGVRAVEALPEDESGWQALVMAELRLGTYARIGERLEKARAVKDTPALACHSAQVLVELDRLDEAELAMTVCRDAETEALVGNAESALAQALGDDSAVREWVEELGDDAATSHHRAVEAFNRGAFDEAEVRSSHAMKLGYPTPAPRLLRAQARYEQGKEAAARRDLKAVLGDEGSWVKVTKRGGLTGVLTKKQELELDRWMRGGAVVLVLLHADSEEFKAATGALAAGREAFGDYPSLKAAEAYVLRRRGEDGKAWSMLAESLAGEPDGWVLRIASVILEDGAATITDEAVEAVAQHGSPTLIYNLAIGTARAAQQTRCARLVDVLLAGLPGKPEQPEGWEADRTRLLPQALGLGYDCAVRAPDLDAAERFGEAAGWTTVSAWAAVSHGDQLYDGKNPDAMLAHLERCKATEGEQADWAVDLIVRVHLDREDLDQALVWARHASAGPVTRYNVGTALAVAKRNAEAKELLEATCPEMEGEAAKACRTNLEIVNEVLAE